MKKLTKLVFSAFALIGMLSLFIQANQPNDHYAYPETHVWEMVRSNDVYLYNKVTGEVRRFPDNPSDNHGGDFIKKREVVTGYITQQEMAK